MAQQHKSRAVDAGMAGGASKMFFLIKVGVDEREGVDKKSGKKIK